MRGQTRVIFRNGHKQSPLPFELYRQRDQVNNDNAFFPTTLKRHPSLDAGLPKNFLRDHQSTGAINARFHNIEITICWTICQAKANGGLYGTSPSEIGCAFPSQFGLLFILQRRTDDKNLYQLCIEENRALVKLDLDFSNVLSYPPENTAGLIVLRGPDNLIPPCDQTTQYRWSLDFSKI